MGNQPCAIVRARRMLAAFAVFGLVLSGVLVSTTRICGHLAPR